MPILLRILLLFGFVVEGCLAAEQTEGARQMLGKMMQAMEGLNYQGTVALFRNGKLETMKFSHAVNGDVKQERLLLLNSPMREMIRNEDTVWCVYLDSKKMVIDHRPVKQSFLMDLPDDLSGLEQYYSFAITGGEKVATLSAKVILIEPRDNHRYARKIWIAQDHYLPLKFELINRTGEAMEQAMFTELQVKESLPLINFNDHRNFFVQHIHKPETLPFDQTGFVLKNLPEGFEKIQFTRIPMQGTENLTEHLLLSDGFSTISIYLERGNMAKQTKQRSVGAVNSYSRPLDENYFLTVMGEVPAKTVQYIAGGAEIRLKND